MNGKDASGAIRVAVKRKIFPAVGDREAQLVLQDIAFEVAPRSFLVITGPSGCGKSTLLNIIAGLDRDYEGAIDLGPAKDGVTFIFQTPRLLPWRTLYENIALALPDGDPRHAEIPAMLDRVGLREAQNAYPEMLSLGMQRRAALARGFILEPKILLMDEPFVSLDDPTAASLRELLMDLWRRHPTTVIFVTHDRSEAIQLGTRILRLAPGQASVAQDVAVALTDAQRHDRAAVLQEQSRIFAI
ncbi:ABC transporter related protein [Hyphomicrobium denitrificans ATCC 51888]|uniref:ABC transporter related protein n=1 Tax=Hyphomicrobium denitrificans (strain ATCC 51888 / DSM 1869 / NCIMB 11706 / TK 0415) TaxID=582899 RepID=D8JXR8_HYPDA|nr:ATP-binding cassette domain-containing protein [Hyphomicrobium denitrificans]ADJ23277.1 ABC transporter related protein [Hyphomicrobium denitrificans ATCC 51888]